MVTLSVNHLLSSTNELKDVWQCKITEPDFAQPRCKQRPDCMNCNRDMKQKIHWAQRRGYNKPWDHRTKENKNLYWPL